MWSQFFNARGYTFGCCGKVNCHVNGRNIVGYIVSENNDLWTIKLENDKEIRIGCVHCNNDSGKYKYPVLTSNSRRHVITQYWPIHVLLHETGEIRLHRIDSH